MILSLIAMTISILSFQARKKTRILLLQSIGSAFYLVSYAFAGGGIGVCLNVIYLIRNFLYSRIDGKSVKFRRTVCAGLCVSYFITYAVYTALSGLPQAENGWNLMPIIGSVFGTLAALQTDMIRFRLLKVVDCFAWISYNCHIGLGAIGGIIGDSLSIISIAVAIWRIRRENAKE